MFRFGEIDFLISHIRNQQHKINKLSTQCIIQIKSCASSDYWYREFVGAFFVAYKVPLTCKDKLSIEIDMNYHTSLDGRAVSIKYHVNIDDCVFIIESPENKNICHIDYALLEQRVAAYFMEDRTKQSIEIKTRTEK